MATPPIVTQYAGPTPYKLTNVETNINVFNSNIPFYPNQLSNLAIWLDGTDVLGNGTILSPGVSIPTWVNKASNSITVTQTGLFEAEPICNDNSDGVFFNNPNNDGTKSGFDTTYGGSYNNETIFILLNNDNSTNPGDTYTLLCPSVSQGRKLSLLSNSSAISRLNTERYLTNTVLVAGDVTTGVNTLVSQKTSLNLNVFHYINGLQIQSSAMGTGFTSGGTTVIGTDNYGNGGFNGNISEIIIYSNALSDSDRQKVESYLFWKWNTFTLDPSNPYTTQAYSNQVSLYPKINSNVIPPVPRNLYSGLPTLDSNNYPLIQNFIQLPNRLKNSMF